MMLVDLDQLKPDRVLLAQPIENTELSREIEKLKSVIRKATRPIVSLDEKITRSLNQIPYSQDERHNL
jgi:hypothetical protein